MKAACFQLPEQLLRLCLQFIFFAADVWNDVPEKIDGGGSGIARAGKRLHSRDDESRRAERAMDWSKRHHQPNGRAIRIRHYRAFPVALFSLRFDHSKVLGIDLGYQQRHILVHTMILGIGHDDIAGARELLLDLTRDRKSTRLNSSHVSIS